MARIKRFPKELANQIAAGEVVERPASALKELIENAIDAGATRVDVELEEGGVSLLSVSDDGCGMDREDLLLAVEPHASSKISSVEELDSIRTLGFRGEALASISSVADLEIVSRVKDADQGWRLRCSFGRQLGLEPAGRRPGTTVTVRDLFLEIPARRAFLKSRRTEQGRCLKVVRQAAAAWPEVRFSVRSGARQLFRSSGSAKGPARVAPLLGEGLQEGLIEIVSGLEGNAPFVHGYLADPDRVRLSSRQVFFFINRRPASAPVLWRALSDALKGRLVKGHHPAAVIFLELAPEEVDVNVHPAKLEVRFRHPDQVYRLVFHAVRDGLERGSLSHSKGLESARGAEVDGSCDSKRPSEGALLFEDAPSARPAGAGTSLNAVLSAEEERVPFPIPEGQERKRADAAAPPVSPSRPTGAERRPRAIGQLADSYILCEGDEGLLILDQHAAHEAVIFKRLMEETGSGNIATQGLAFPVVIELDEAEPSDIEEAAIRLKKAGIELEPFGEDQLLLRAVPAFLPSSRDQQLWIEQFVRQFISSPFSRDADEESFLRQCLARFACRMAIKAGQRLEPAQMQALVDECMEEQVTNCPHGRPIWQELSLSELEKGFRRI